MSSTASGYREWCADQWLNAHHPETWQPGDQAAYRAWSLRQFRDTWRFYQRTGWPDLLRAQIGRDGLVNKVRADLQVALQPVTGNPWSVCPCHPRRVGVGQPPARDPWRTAGTTVLAWLQDTFDRQRSLTMGRRWNPDEIVDLSLLPRGIFLVTIEDLAEEPRASGTPAAYMGEFRVLEPAEYAGWPVTRRFVLGTDDDPDAEDAATLKDSPDLRQLKRLLQCAKVELKPDLDACCEAAASRHVLTQIEIVTEGRGRTQKRRNGCAQWFAVGEHRPGLDVPGLPEPRPATPAGSTPTAAKPAAVAPLIKCSICNKMVAKGELADHVDGHLKEEQ